MPPTLPESFRGPETLPLADAEQFKHLFPPSAAVVQSDDMPSGTELAISAMPDDDDLENIPTACSDAIKAAPEEAYEEFNDPELDLLTNDFSSLPDLESGTDTIPMEAPTPELLEALQQQFRAKMEAQLPEPSELNETVPLINTNDYKDILKQPNDNSAKSDNPSNVKVRVTENTNYSRLEDQDQDSFQIIKNGRIQPSVIIVVILIVLIAGMLGFLLAMLVLR